MLLSPSPPPAAILQHFCNVYIPAILINCDKTTVCPQYERFRCVFKDVDNTWFLPSAFNLSFRHPQRDGHWNCLPTECTWKTHHSSEPRPNCVGSRSQRVFNRRCRSTSHEFVLGASTPSILCVAKHFQGHEIYCHSKVRFLKQTSNQLRFSHRRFVICTGKASTRGADLTRRGRRCAAPINRTNSAASVRRRRRGRRPAAQRSAALTDCCRADSHRKRRASRCCCTRQHRKGRRSAR